MSRVSMNRRFGMGFTLVELMIAITIGLIVLAAATTVMVHNNKNYKVQEDLARIQESARFAMEFLARDIRMAGYFGCMDDVTQVWDHVFGGAGDLFDTSNPIEGSESAAAWAPTGVSVPVNMIAGTDGITIRYLDPSNAVDMEPPYMGQPSGVLHVVDPNGLQNGQIVAVTDCESTDIFQITSGNPDTSGTVGHNTGGSVQPGNINAGVPNCPGGNNHCLSKVYEEDAQILTIGSARYFVGTTPNGTNALFRQSVFVDGSGNAVTQDLELVEGIENMQILYGEDLDGNAIPDQFLTAAGVTNWNLVTGVRVGLSSSSVAQLGNQYDQDNGNYDIDRNGTDDITNPGDRRRRRIFTMTVLMRNL